MSCFLDIYRTTQVLRAQEGWLHLDWAAKCINVAPLHVLLQQSGSAGSKGGGDRQARGPLEGEGENY
jgi:hypothetical protein